MKPISYQQEIVDTERLSCPGGLHRVLLGFLSCVSWLPTLLPQDPETQTCLMRLACFPGRPPSRFIPRSFYLSCLFFFALWPQTSMFRLPCLTGMAISCINYINY